MARKAKKKAAPSKRRKIECAARMSREEMLAAVDNSHAAHLLRFRNRVHTAAKENGWWDLPRDTGTLLMLVVSEIAEAMEGFRKDLMDDKLPHHKMFDVEICDAIIRLFDLAGHMNIDVGKVIIEKLAYNAKRGDVPKRDKSKNRKRF